MSIMKVFKSTVPHSRYVFKNGDVAVFTGAEYMTDDEMKIGELTQEIVKFKHPNLYIDPARSEFDPENHDPLQEFKDKVIAEYLARQNLVAGNAQRDMGTSEVQKLKPANSGDVAGIAVGGAASGGVNTFQLPANLQTALAALGVTPDATAGVIPKDVVDADASAGMAALSVFANALPVAAKE